MDKNMIGNILIITLLIEVLICIYALLRNNWVYRNRIALIGTDEYKKLPPYDEILQGHRFWCWDFKNYYL